jgi:hypothetical protein
MKEIIFEEWNPQNYKIKLWERLALIFVKPRFSIDTGYSNSSITYKIWRGKFYVIGENLR